MINLIGEYLAAIKDTFRILQRERVRITLLLVSAIILIATNELLLKRFTLVTEGLFPDIIIGLAIEILGAIIFFSILEHGIERIGELSLFRIREYPHLPAFEFIEAVNSKATQQVKILDTWTYLTNEDIYRNDFSTAIKQSLKRGVHVKILLIRPGTDGASSRAQELEGIVDVNSELNICIGRMTALQIEVQSEVLSPSKSNDNLEIRLYDSDPSITMHQWDSEAYWSFFPPRDRADKNPHLKVSVNTQLGSFLAGEFEKRWNDSKTIILDTYINQSSA